MLHTVSEYLHNAARKYPEHAALVDSKSKLIYADFEIEAGSIALNLIKRNLFKKPIAVFMDKSVQTIVTFFGIAMSGNFYTVIDTKMPEQRIRKIIETFQPEIIITDNSNFDKAKSMFDAEIISYDTAVNVSWSELEISAISDAESRIIDTDVLYVLFTSGSTGIPKGVIISHRSVIDYTEWVTETFGIDSNSVFGNQAPFYFDNSVLDIYSSVRNGATLHIIPTACFSFPIRLLEYIRDNGINTVFWVPTVLCRVADTGVLAHCDVSCLKKVLFAGEVMPARQLNIWRKMLPNALFANLYGPTEITVDCIYYIVNREIAYTESVPIGFPCCNTDILILNDKNELVECDEKGEICVRGTSLALGYYNNPEKTNEVFVQNPLNSMYRELIYRTGDIAHYNSLGEIIYDGRADFQIKHMGHRIELGEIETAVSAISGISMNCCLYNSDKNQIVLYYTGEPSGNHIRKILKGKIPEYMIPNVLNKVSVMPLNMNGKIDRVKLKEMMANS